MRRLAVALSLLAAPAFAGSREVSIGAEEFHYRTEATALNRDNVLGLDEDEDLLRATLGWKETHGALRLVFRGFLEKRLSSGADAEATVREAYAQYGFGDGMSVRVGKQRVGWGSGLAWNPTNRLEPPKNPLNTGLEQEGARAARLDFIPTAWAGIILVASETDAEGPDLPFDAVGPERRTGAVRTRFLVRDTDAAVVFSGGTNQRTLVGLDLGRTFGAWSAHAEASTYAGAELPPARDDERFYRVVAGVLWTRDQTSVGAEYFYNGEGYGQDALDAYLGALDRSYAASVDPQLPPAVRAEARDSYLRLAAAPFTGGLGLRRHYAHASVSRGTASGVWTTALRAVVGLDDGGTALTPGVVWAPRGSLTVNLDGVVLLGPDDSEYRLSPFRGALQARMKVLW